MVSARFVCCHNLLIYSHYNCIIARRYYLFTAHNHYHYNSVQECITITTTYIQCFVSDSQNFILERHCRPAVTARLADLSMPPRTMQPSIGGEGEKT